MRRGRLIALALLAALIVGGCLAVSYWQSFQTLQVRCGRCQNLQAYSISAEGEADEKAQASATFTNGVAELKLRNGSYSLSYQAGNDYAAGSLVTDISADKIIDIKPDFSEQKINSLLDAELPAIQSVLQQKYPAITSYTINRGKLFKEGQWYGTTLTYRGSDAFNKDTLRVVLRKQNNSWHIATDPPNISLSKYQYPEVPVEVLRDVNNHLD